MVLRCGASMSCTMSTKLSESAVSMEPQADAKCYTGETLTGEENTWGILMQRNPSSIFLVSCLVRSSLHTTTQCDQCG
jgi:hypothetical protein